MEMQMKCELHGTSNASMVVCSHRKSTNGALVFVGGICVMRSVDKCPYID